MRHVSIYLKIMIKTPTTKTGSYPPCVAHMWQNIQRFKRKKHKEGGSMTIYYIITKMFSFKKNIEFIILKIVNKKEKIFDKMLNKHTLSLQQTLGIRLYLTHILVYNVTRL